MIQKMNLSLPNGPILSFQSEQALRQFGENIKTARLRRGESEEMAAQRTGVSRQTWRRLEQGLPTVSMGLMFEAMTIYGFAEQLFYLADPDTDADGKAYDAARRLKRGKTY